MNVNHPALHAQVSHVSTFVPTYALVKDTGNGSSKLSLCTIRMVSAG
jgi:hypothetical protein